MVLTSCLARSHTRTHNYTHRHTHLHPRIHTYTLTHTLTHTHTHTHTLFLPQVVSGMSVVRAMEKLGTSGGKPARTVTIAQSGQL